MLNTKTKICIGAGIAGLISIPLLVKVVSAQEEQLSLQVYCESGCESNTLLTFSGMLKDKEGKGIEGENIYVVNETTRDAYGPALTIHDGIYSISITAPYVIEETTFQYRSYVEDQLPI